MRFSGNLFVFEGVDGTGKTSLVEAFSQFVCKNGDRVRALAFPGKERNTIGDLVYRFHHNPKSFGVESYSALSLQSLHIAAHLDVIERAILPALASGECIVLDRYWWSTWAYGMIDGVQPKTLNALIDVERSLWGKQIPTVLFYITRGGPLRPEPIEKWQRAKAAYDRLLSMEMGKYPIEVIPNNSSIDAAMDEITSRLSQ